MNHFLKNLNSTLTGSPLLLFAESSIAVRSQSQTISLQNVYPEHYALLSLPSGTMARFMVLEIWGQKCKQKIWLPHTGAMLAASLCFLHSPTGPFIPTTSSQPKAIPLPLLVPTC